MVVSDLLICTIKPDKLLNENTLWINLHPTHKNIDCNTTRLTGMSLQSDIPPDQERTATTTGSLSSTSGSVEQPPVEVPVSDLITGLPTNLMTVHQPSRTYDSLLSSSSNNNLTSISSNANSDVRRNQFFNNLTPTPPKMWKEHLPSYFQLLESWFMRHHICNELEKFDLLLSAMTETQQCTFGTDIGYCATSSSPYSNIKSKILQPTSNYNGRYQWVMDV